MVDKVATLDRAGYEIEVDEWGGVHFELPEDAIEQGRLSVDPEIMQRLVEVRREEV